MTLAFRIVIHCHDGGIDQSSIPPSVTVDDATNKMRAQCHIINQLAFSCSVYSY